MHYQTKDNGECLEIRYRWWVAISLVLATAVFTFMAMTTDRKALTATTAALIFFLFFVNTILYIWKPVIRFCEDGIHYKRGSFFPWHAVKDIYSYKNKYGKIIGIEIYINTASPDSRYHSTLIERINGDSLAKWGRLKVLYFHTNPLHDRATLERRLQDMHRQYYIAAKGKGILYLTKNAQEQILNFEQGLADLEVAYKELGLSDIDYRQAKRSYVEGIKVFKQTGLPPYLHDVYH